MESYYKQTKEEEELTSLSLAITKNYINKQGTHFFNNIQLYSLQNMAEKKNWNKITQRSANDRAQ